MAYSVYAMLLSNYKTHHSCCGDGIGIGAWHFCMPCSINFSLILQIEISDFLKQIIYSSHLILCLECLGAYSTNSMYWDR